MTNYIGALLLLKNHGQVVIPEIGEIRDIITELVRETEKRHVLEFHKRTELVLKRYKKYIARMIRNINSKRFSMY